MSQVVGSGGSLFVFKGVDESMLPSTPSHKHYKITSVSTPSTSVQRRAMSTSPQGPDTRAVFVDMEYSAHDRELLLILMQANGKWCMYGAWCMMYDVNMHACMLRAYCIHAGMHACMHACCMRCCMRCCMQCCMRCCSARFSDLISRSPRFYRRRCTCLHLFVHIQAVGAAVRCSAQVKWAGAAGRCSL